MKRKRSDLDNFFEKFATLEGLEAKKQQIVEDEIFAIRLTTSIEGHDEPRPKPKYRKYCDLHYNPNRYGVVKLSNGLLEDLIPFGLTNKAKEHNQWKGLFGRLDWQGNFPTSVTNPQPMGMVGMCFHPDQDRILTAREYARSQGFPDSYEFSGKIKHKHRQIGNAVPQPLAFALGRKLKEALHIKSSLQR